MTDESDEAAELEAENAKVEAPRPAPPRSAKVAKVAKSAADGPDAWDIAGEWLAKHGALPALGVLTIAVFAIHWHVLWGETRGDDLTFHFAESARLADCLRHGDFDFWNPSANGGYASAYYYQVLPQLASAIPAALFGHHSFFFELSVILPLVFAPACAYRGMRLMGATPWQAAVAAFVIAFMNGESRWGAGNAGTFQVGLYTQTWALCVFPLALGHGARWISDGKGLAPAIGWGAFSFLCHPFAGIGLGFAFVIAFLCKFAVTWRLWLSPTMLGVLALYLGGGPLLVVLATKVIPHAPDLPIAAAGAGAVIAAGGAALIWKFRATDEAWRHTSVQALQGELHRLAILGVALVMTTGPVLLPLAIDREGFGGFPHRVGDEVGPGFVALGKWYTSGGILDFIPKDMGRRVQLFTWTLPVIFIFTLFKPGKPMRWLWPPGILFALWLGLGPHTGKVGDDLLPAVRALGAMQTVLALGIGAGAVMFGQWLWNAPWDRWFASRKSEPKGSPKGDVTSLVYGLRTMIAAIAASLIVFVAYPGTRSLIARVGLLGDNPNNHRDEMMKINETLATQPQGRKQVGPGAENHWWNLLSYAYQRVPAVLQMGGGGLQASPNYDFLWTNRDFLKNAWIYDAPYLVFERSKGETMPVGETILRTDNYELRKLPAPGLVSPAQVIGVLPPWYRTGELGHIFALEWIKTSMGPNDQLLAYAGSGGVGPPPQGRTIRAWRQDSPGDDADIVAEVEATGPTTFWVHESWHPRWRAYVDGVETPIRRVTPDFPAVDVGPGKHVIELRFERPAWALLVWLVWPGLAIAAWLVFRKRPPFLIHAH